MWDDLGRHCHFFVFEADGPTSAGVAAGGADGPCDAVESGAEHVRYRVDGNVAGPASST